MTAKIRNIIVGKCIELIGVIHADICGSFTPTMGSHKYYITFINYYSRYGFVELICVKFDSLEAFKAKVEL